MLSVKMQMEKETKGAIRFEEIGKEEEKVLRTLYVRKSAFKDGKFPQQISVSVEW